MGNRRGGKAKENKRDIRSLNGNIDVVFVLGEEEHHVPLCAAFISRSTEGREMTEAPPVRRAPWS